MKTGTRIEFMLQVYKLFINNVYDEFENLLDKALESNSWEGVREYVVNNTQCHLS